MGWLLFWLRVNVLDFLCQPLIKFKTKDGEKSESSTLKHRAFAFSPLDSRGTNGAQGHFFIAETCPVCCGDQLKPVVKCIIVFLCYLPQVWDSADNQTLATLSKIYRYIIFPRMKEIAIAYESKFPIHPLALTLTHLSEVLSSV